MDRNIKELQDLKKELEADYEAAIARGEETGKATIGGYTLKVEVSTKEKRTIEMDIVKKHIPEIMFKCGKYDAPMISKYLTPIMREMLLSSGEFEDGYKLGLGELDKALGGKAQSAQYVTVEITPTETKTITRLPIAPIVEV